MAISVQAESFIKTKGCRDVLSGHWSATGFLIDKCGKVRLVLLGLLKTQCSDMGSCFLMKIMQIYFAVFAAK